MRRKKDEKTKSFDRFFHLPHPLHRAKRERIISSDVDDTFSLRYTITDSDTAVFEQSNDGERPGTGASEASPGSKPSRSSTQAPGLSGRLSQNS
jgi:hypothetical protein